MKYVGYFDDFLWSSPADNFQEYLVAFVLQCVADGFENGTTESEVSAHGIGKWRAEPPLRKRRCDIRSFTAMPLPVLCSASGYAPRSHSHIRPCIDGINQLRQQRR